MLEWTTDRTTGNAFAQPNASTLVQVLRGPKREPYYHFAINRVRMSNANWLTSDEAKSEAQRYVDGRAAS